MDKQNVIYTHNGILFSFKRKAIKTHAIAQMNLEDSMLGEMSPVTKRQILYDFTYMNYLEQSDS